MTIIKFCGNFKYPPYIFNIQKAFTVNIIVQYRKFVSILCFLIFFKYFMILYNKVFGLCLVCTYLFCCFQVFGIHPLHIFYSIVYIHTCYQRTNGKDILLIFLLLFYFEKKYETMKSCHINIITAGYTNYIQLHEKRLLHCWHVIKMYNIEVEK